LLMDSPLCRE